MAGAEAERLEQDARRERNWKRWGPYLAERQWGTVREDYSADGNVWDYFSHDQSRSRAYRWGEDGLLGITDRQGRLCFALALWNGRDPILKERLFGLTGPEGNHGEDVKELYYYLDATPTHSYLKGSTSTRRPRSRTRSWSVSTASAASWSPSSSCSTRASSTKSATSTSSRSTPRRMTERLLIRITVANRGPDTADAPPAADRVVPQHLELGPSGRGLLAAPVSPGRRPDHDHRRPHGRSVATCSKPSALTAPLPRSCSPRTRPIWPGCSARRTRSRT